MLVTFDFIGNPRRRRKQSYQTLFEVLGQLLAPDKTSEIIEAALEDLGWSELPSSRSRFELLVNQAVAPRVEALLGSADAEVVIEELLRIAQLMPNHEPPNHEAGEEPAHEVPRSGERPTTRPSREAGSLSEAARGPARVTLPAPADLVVAFATASSERLERLESRVAGTARVRGIRDAISLFDVLQSEPVALLLVDLIDPALRWPTLLALAEDVPPTAEVCVWCSDASLRESVEACGWSFVLDERDLEAAVDRLSA